MLRGDNGTTADGAAEKLDIDDGQHQAESFFCLRLQLAGMPITAGILYPFFGLLMSQIIAAPSGCVPWRFKSFTFTWRES
jgi:hypothetical protein